MMGLVSKTQVLRLILTLHAAALLSAKPATEKVEDATKGNSLAMHEEQLTVWPSDVEDLAEAVKGPLSLPVIEEPIVVMPVMDDDEYDSFEGLDVGVVVSLPPPAEDDGSVQVLENYHKTYANGTEEHKLTLSSGMVNYKRIDYKDINGKQLAVQEGYYTVPTAGVPAAFKTIYYRADENGYNVYKTEQSPRNPAYDIYLQYG